MNYLVHLYLSGADRDVRLGGLMGDFVKGPLPKDLPVSILRGLRLHRRVDVFAQHSPDTQRSRRRLDPRFGHGRGIVVDIFYDHFLAASWDQFSTQPLEDFAAGIYSLLEQRHDSLPDGLQEIAPRMIRHDWLTSYRQPKVVGRALERIAQRLSRPLPLADAVIDLARHGTALRDDFHRFLTGAAALARTEFGIEGLTA